MLTFCPTCANLLLVEHGGSGFRFYCQTCPYVYGIEQKIRKPVPLQQKEIEDVFGGDEAWANLPKAQVTCPKCSHGEASFMEIQTRSADEPATLFFRCPKCTFQWKEG